MEVKVKESDINIAEPEREEKAGRCEATACILASVSSVGRNEWELAGFSRVWLLERAANQGDPG